MVISFTELYTGVLSGYIPICLLTLYSQSENWSEKCCVLSFTLVRTGAMLYNTCEQTKEQEILL